MAITLRQLSTRRPYLATGRAHNRVVRVLDEKRPCNCGFPSRARRRRLRALGSGAFTISMCGAKKSCGKNWATCTGIQWLETWWSIPRTGRGAVGRITRREGRGLIAIDSLKHRTGSGENPHP